ncbi:MAG: type II toxin-antitoxin system VapC family toxin [Verrucomicrobia bacterium]|nr:type II toxin-antitoxin system VapC family toxin [Verrucomicrobiota bacterium]
MRPKVYIETTIPSFYHCGRKDPESVAMHHWTREWWDQRRTEFFLATSAAALLEIENGHHPLAAARLEFLHSLPLLSLDEEAVEIAQIYIDRLVMPRDQTGDALHLALASWHKCDILLTWNCKHLANYRKTQQIRRINTALGIHIPELLTPLELLNHESDL